MSGVFRALALGLSACLLLMVAWVTILVAWTGRWEHALHNIPDVAAAFAFTFTVTAVVLFVPVFLTIDRAVAIKRRRPILLTAGVLLGVVAYFAFNVTFTESEDPQTVMGWLQLWARRPVEQLRAATPFVIAGPVFAFIWLTRRR